MEFLACSLMLPCYLQLKRWELNRERSELTVTLYVLSNLLLAGNACSEQQLPNFRAFPHFSAVAKQGDFQHLGL